MGIPDSALGARQIAAVGVAKRRGTDPEGASRADGDAGDVRAVPDDVDRIGDASVV